MTNETTRQTGVVMVVYTGDRWTEQGPVVGTASSKYGAIRAARDAGHRVLTVGGLIQWDTTRDDEPGRWIVTVYPRD